MNWTENLNELCNHNKPPLIILTGPTAVGKTALSLKLAKAVNGEIISADSMQVYKGMDIGTAKIREDERKGIPHHLIDILDPEQNFDVFSFQRLAKSAVTDILGRGHVPILTGGTGFYIQAVIRDVDFEDSLGQTSVRSELEEAVRQGRSRELWDELQEADPESAAIIHPNNSKRLIRALEFFRETGKPISEHNKEQQQKGSPFRFYYFVLNQDRAELYSRINRRVDKMMEQGLEKEAEVLIKKRHLAPDLTSMKAIGYREWFDYFAGRSDLDRTVEQIKEDTRHFAKRQLTWFRREKDVIWISKEDFDFDEDRILTFMLDVMREGGPLL
ncbi:MAG: tRNA (adenosine(37)-N6)-dimethylallyltransferase MiaA [Eubacterium sp.]|nr:tRNA (adenosine(37)-N6)-dimethylallyltransferase MiaA [Eubacterium sp.]